jgi:pentatricopeptide repeat protein
MTTNQFISLEKNLLPDLPSDFAIKKRLLLIVPVKHILRGINFEGSDFDSNSFYATFFVMPLCVPSKYLTFTFGERIRHLRGADRWNSESPDELAEFKNALKQQAIPYLSRVESLGDFVGMAKSSPSFSNPHIPNNIAYSLAREGNFEQAIELFDQISKGIEEKGGWERELAEQARLLGSQLRENPAVVQRQLEALEIETLRNLGLEEFRGN